MDGGHKINMIQRDGYIQSASMIGGKGCSTCRFEQICIYISGLTQLTATEAVSVVRGKESHTATCPVPYCYVCGTSVGQKNETTSLYAATQSYWSHTDHCMGKKMCGYVKEKAYYPLQIPGNYFPNMDHIEFIEAQLTKEGMLAYDSTLEASIAAFQEMILCQRRSYFDALNQRYTPDGIAREPAKINFSYPLMHMIATGQLFEPYLYHPDANVEERRQESEYCLQQLEEWISLFDRRKMPKNMEMDWDGVWLSSDFVKRWDRNYVIPDVALELKPEFHPTRYHVQPNAIRMILPAKGMLPVGSYIGSPGFGLTHPTTISAAVLQSAGFIEEDQNPDNPMKFDAISLAPNFDFPTGRYRMNDIVNMISGWTLCEPDEEDELVCIPPDDLSFDDFVNFRHVPVIQRDAWDQEVHQTVFKTVTAYSEDQLLAHHGCNAYCHGNQCESNYVPTCSQGRIRSNPNPIERCFD